MAGTKPDRPGHDDPTTGVALRVMPALVAGIHVLLNRTADQVVDGRDVSAFTRVFDALCPAMTTLQVIA
jgi:hypothetical protein